MKLTCFKFEQYHFSFKTFMVTNFKNIVVTRHMTDRQIRTIVCLLADAQDFFGLPSAGLGL